ncbi:MAG: hypothetical protein IH598_04320 [Bacteroidales bacterium]|nr:hypothetical protein [Bacteroidales bacterium]
MRHIFTRLLLLMKGRLNIVLLTFLLLPVAGWAQFYNGYQMEFGRSRVQFKDFLWTYYKFDRFDTYFYLNGKELAEHTARYATTELVRMETELGTYLEGKIQFVIFNNLNDLKQSNIGLSAGAQYNTGGVSYILGNKVVLYFDGSIVNLELQIRQGIAHVLLQNSIFGSNITSQVMNSFLQNLPQWFTLGLISYLADDWNTDIDNKIRNVVLSGKYKDFNRIVMDELYVRDAGHAFWRFIAEKYGRDNVVSIINMIRVSRNIETGFQYVIGVSLKTLYQECFEYYKSIYSAEDVRFDAPPDDKQLVGKRVLKRNIPSRNYSQLKASPTGEHLAFVTNETGKYHVWLLNPTTNKLKRLRTGGYRLDEKVDYSYPILAWQPTGRILSMVIEEKGLLQLYFYDLEERKWTKRNLFGFEKIIDFSYSDNGQLLLLSAVQEGQSDIFTFNLVSGSYDRITNDIYDDLHPRFIESSTKIIFSSNRTSDTLQAGEKGSFGSQNTTYDVFIYDLATRKPAMRRVTDTPLVNEMQPMQYGKNYVTYLTDESGINNQHIGKPDSAVAYVDTTVHYRFFTKSYPLTNFSRSIISHQIEPRSATNAFILNKNMLYTMYRDDLVLPGRIESVEPGQTDYIKSLVPTPKQIILIPDREEPVFIEPPDEQKTIQRPRKSFRNVMRDDTFEAETIPLDIDSLQRIDFDHYRLERQGIIGINMPDSVNAMQNRFNKEESETPGIEFKVPVQRNYYTEYSVNQLVTQIDFSYLNQTYQPFSSSISPGYNYPGLSPTFKVGITDLMENYRIMGGMRIGLDLVDKEFFINYANLRHRLDKEFIFQHRYMEEIIGSTFALRQKVYEGFVILTYPFNRVLRIRSTFLLRNENYIIAGPDELLLREPNTMNNWGGAKLQLIYDDSRELAMNLPQGTKFMAFAEYNQQVDDAARNLMVLGFDLRNYKRINRHFIWANRVAGSTNIGHDKLIYFMGGTDGWVLPTFDQTTRIDPDQRWIYQTLATNMRGFYQNARNGNNFLVINSELRFPVFTYLLNRPISSELVKHFQLVAFGDLGSAWTGWNPYDEDNVLYTKYEYFGPLRIKVQYEKDPIIGGLGFGARTKLLGYFMKGDLAWGIEDGKFKKNPVFYFSMSLDF